MRKVCILLVLCCGVGLGCDYGEYPVTDPEGIVLVVKHNTFNGGRIYVRIQERYDEREDQIASFSFKYMDSKRFTAHGLATYELEFVIPKYQIGSDVWRLVCYVYLDTPWADPYDIIIETPGLERGDYGLPLHWSVERLD